METTEALPTFYSQYTRTERFADICLVSIQMLLPLTWGFRVKNFMIKQESLFPNLQSGLETKHPFSLLGFYWILFNKQDFVTQFLCETEQEQKLQDFSHALFVTAIKEQW